MAFKTVDTVQRKAQGESRFLEVTRGEGKDRVVERLTTPITKVNLPPAFRFGASPRPIEQYAFEVGNKRVERFADAAALVMRKHHVRVAAAEDQPAYIQRAVRILEGQEELRLATAG